MIKIKRGPGRPKKIDKKAVDAFLKDKKVSKEKDDYLMEDYKTSRKDIVSSKTIFKKKEEESSEDVDLQRIFKEIDTMGRENITKIFNVILEEAQNNNDLQACFFLSNRILGSEVKGQFFPYELSICHGITLINVLKSMQEVFVLLSKSKITDFQATVIQKLLETPLNALKMEEESKLSEIERRCKQLENHFGIESIN